MPMDYVTTSASPRRPYQSATTGQSPANDPAVHAAFDHFYNTDYEAAIQEFEAVLRTRPNDALAVNHLLEAILLREISRQDILTGQLYVGNEFLHAKRQPMDAQIQARIEMLAAEAILLSEARLKANPNDVEALYSHGATRALYAVYEGLLEKSWYSALRSALGAYRDHKRVLELKPDYSDAKLVVGVYDYVVAALPIYQKVAAFLFNIRGDKKEGIEEVRQAANGGGEASVDAKTALGLFLAREHQYPEGLVPIRELYGRYPHNFEFAEMEASLLRDSGNLTEAAAAYRNLLGAGQRKVFLHPHLDRPAVSLGQIYRARGNSRDAAAAFELAAATPGAETAECARANLLAGEMYDLLGERDTALGKYRQVIGASGDSIEAEQAKRMLKRPYREN